MLYLDGAEYDKAEAALQKVMNHFPHEAILQSDAGMISFRRGQYTKALEDFNRAIAANPDDAFSAYHKAETLEHMGRQGEAIKIYQELLITIPDFTKLHFRLGRLLTDEGQTGAGHYQLGKFFWLNGDHKNAKYHLNQALKDKTSDKKTIDLANTQLDKIKEVEKE
jgi:predicted Zn-dependent protease